MVALVGHNTHSSVIVAFHSPRLWSLKGWAAGRWWGWGVRSPLLWSQLCRHIDVSIHPISLSLSKVHEGMAGGLGGESSKGGPLGTLLVGLHTSSWPSLGSF